MIERLNQLSLAQFIELSCGDNSVLLEEMRMPLMKK